MNKIINKADVFDVETKDLEFWGLKVSRNSWVNWCKF